MLIKTPSKIITRHPLTRLACLCLLVLSCAPFAVAQSLILYPGKTIELVDQKMADSDAEHALSYAMIMYRDKKHYAAIELLRTIIEYSTSDDILDDSHLLLGQLLYKNNDRQGALETFKKLFALYPKGNIVSEQKLKTTIEKIIALESEIEFLPFALHLHRLHSDLGQGENEAMDNIVSKIAALPTTVVRRFKVNLSEASWKKAGYSNQGPMLFRDDSGRLKRVFEDDLYSNHKEEFDKAVIDQTIDEFLKRYVGEHIWGPEAREPNIYAYMMHISKIKATGFQVIGQKDEFAKASSVAVEFEIETTTSLAEICVAAEINMFKLAKTDRDSYSFKTW